MRAGSARCQSPPHEQLLFLPARHENAVLLRCAARHAQRGAGRRRRRVTSPDADGCPPATRSHRQVAGRLLPLPREGESRWRHSPHSNQAAGRSLLLPWEGEKRRHRNGDGQEPTSRGRPSGRETQWSAGDTTPSAIRCCVSPCPAPRDHRGENLKTVQFLAIKERISADRRGKILKTLFFLADKKGTKTFEA